MKTISHDALEKRMREGNTPTPVQRKTVKMIDGVELRLSEISVGARRVHAFFVNDIGFLSDSVLYGVFLSVGGSVCALSREGDGYRLKLFSPDGNDFSSLLD